MARTEADIRAKLATTLYTAGCDEAGAGCWAGDLLVAAVILNPSHPIMGLDDSKKLTERAREALYPQIVAGALDYSIIHVTPEEIDKINILQARMEGMKRAILGLRKIDYAIFDGNRTPQGLAADSDFLIKGDAKLACIAAASILAKVTRDRMMTSMDAQFPGYGFAKHKSYGTAEHQAALDRLGPCSIHRKSYKPVRLASLKHFPAQP